MVARVLVSTVIIITITCTQAAVCTFQSRPDQSVKRYSAVVEGKHVYGSAAQEHNIFFERSLALHVSYVCCVGLFWAVSSAAATIMLTKTIPQFGWKLNRPNLSVGLAGMGSFLMGLHYGQHLFLALAMFDNDLAYYKVERTGIFVSLGWICYFFALYCFTALWVDIARAAGCEWRSKTIRWSITFLMVLLVAVFVSNIVTASIFLGVSEDSTSSLSALDTDSKRFETMPEWYVDSLMVNGFIGFVLYVVAFVILMVAAVLMKMAVSKKDFGTENTFVKITLINFYFQMLFNAVFLVFIILVISASAADRVRDRGVRVFGLWLLNMMALSWGVRFIVIFAYTVDQGSVEPVAKHDPLKVFGASPETGIEGGAGIEEAEVKGEV